MGLLSLIPTEIWAGVLTSVLAFFGERASEKQKLLELAIQQGKDVDESQNQATKRFPTWVRSAIALTMTVGLCGAIIAAAWDTEMPVTLAREVPQKSILYGLFTWGRTLEVVELEGLAIIPMLSHGFFCVIGAVFGRITGRTNR